MCFPFYNVMSVRAAVPFWGQPSQILSTLSRNGTAVLKGLMSTLDLSTPHIYVPLWPAKLPRWDSDANVKRYVYWWPKSGMKWTYRAPFFSTCSQPEIDIYFCTRCCPLSLNPCPDLLIWRPSAQLLICYVRTYHNFICPFRRMNHVPFGGIQQQQQCRRLNGGNLGFVERY